MFLLHSLSSVRMLLVSYTQLLLSPCIRKLFARLEVFSSFPPLFYHSKSHIASKVHKQNTLLSRIPIATGQWVYSALTAMRRY